MRIDRAWMGRAGALVALMALSLASFAGCGGSVESGGSAGAAAGGSTGGSGATDGGGGTAATDGGGGTAANGGSGATGGGERCGNVTCPSGQYCCNESCSMCAPPDVDCPAIACVDAGQRPVCGETLCAEGERCCDPECGVCGPIGMGCPDIACAVSCGNVTCEPGQSCCNESCGICTYPGESCSDVECAPECNAQDARGQGDCDMFLGWAWMAGSCAPLSGCSCAGADCIALFPDEPTCLKAYANCPQWF